MMICWCSRHDPQRGAIGPHNQNLSITARTIQNTDMEVHKCYQRPWCYYFVIKRWPLGTFQPTKLYITVGYFNIQFADYAWPLNYYFHSYPESILKHLHNNNKLNNNKDLFLNVSNGKNWIKNRNSYYAIHFASWPSQKLDLCHNIYFKK